MCAAAERLVVDGEFWFVVVVSAASKRLQKGLSFK
jgi:hypothetical protein